VPPSTQKVRRVGGGKKVCSRGYAPERGTDVKCSKVFVPGLVSLTKKEERGRKFKRLHIKGSKTVDLLALKRLFFTGRGFIERGRRAKVSGKV